MNNKNKMMKFLLKNKIFPLENEKDIMNFIVSLSYQHGSTSDGVPYINSDEFSNEFKNEYLNQEFYDVKKYSENSLKNSQFKDIYEIKLPRVLRYTDRLSMKYGIETRVPFLNHNFFEYGFNLKPNLKFKDNKSRWAFKKYIKNKFSYEKNKKTIVDPQKLWFKTYFKEMFLDTFSSTDFRNMNIFSQKNILKSYNNFLKNDSETSFNFIQIFSTYKFIKLFK